MVLNAVIDSYKRFLDANYKNVNDDTVRFINEDTVITVVELTKQTAIYATNVGSWVVPGILCAIAYLALSLPLSGLARRLERRWNAV